MYEVLASKDSHNEKMQQRVNTIAGFLSSYHYQDIPILLLQVKGEKML